MQNRVPSVLLLSLCSVPMLLSLPLKGDVTLLGNAPPMISFEISHEETNRIEAFAGGECMEVKDGDVLTA